MKNLKDESEIQGYPFLAGASQDFVSKLLLFDQPKPFKAGDVIFREGEYANCFYLVQQGTVLLETVTKPGEPPMVIQELGPGDILGWSWLFPPFVWHFTARAVTDCKMAMFNAPALLIHAEENSAFGYELMKRLSQQVIQRLQNTRNLMVKERINSTLQSTKGR